MRKVEVKDAAQLYNAPGHFDMRAIRLHSKRGERVRKLYIRYATFPSGWWYRIAWSRL